jgi:membrane protease YdiL (CAAX protease family)
MRGMTIGRLSLARTALLTIGLACAVVLRLAFAGPAGDTSIRASLVFSASLLALAAAAGWRPSSPSYRATALGVAGACALCVVPAIRFLHTTPLGVPSWQGFPQWAISVAIVAGSEELLFRGAIYAEVEKALGDLSAILLAAALFAAMHIVLNGGHAFYLDASVGVWLGVLRMSSGGVAAPATAHILADLAAWWLR